MAMHDYGAKVLVAGEKGLPCPELIMPALPRKGYPGCNPGVDKAIASLDMVDCQAGEELPVRIGKRIPKIPPQRSHGLVTAVESIRDIDSVAGQRCQPATTLEPIAPPWEVAIDESQRQVFVIAAQCSDFKSRRPPLPQVFDDFEGIRTPAEIVTKEHHNLSFPGSMCRIRSDGFL